MCIYSLRLGLMSGWRGEVVRLGGGGGSCLKLHFVTGGGGGYKVPQAAWVVAGGVKG